MCEQQTTWTSTLQRCHAEIVSTHTRMPIAPSSCSYIDKVNKIYWFKLPWPKINIISLLSLDAMRCRRCSDDPFDAIYWFCSCEQQTHTQRIHTRIPSCVSVTRFSLFFCFVFSFSLLSCRYFVIKMCFFFCFFLHVVMPFATQKYSTTMYTTDGIGMGVEQKRPCRTMSMCETSFIVGIDPIDDSFVLLY